jgi:phospholipid/cholesterol/gamma-HCH transport system permease protein
MFIIRLLKDFALYIGGLLIYSQKHSDGITRLLLKTILKTFTSKIRFKETIRQAYFIGYKSIPFISIIMAILGMILVTEFGTQGVKITGTATEVGGPYLQLIVRQFGPFITGMMLANKVSTAISAEISSMKITDQIDALKMNGADIIQHLVVPRFIAGFFMIFILTIYAVFVAEISGAITAKSVFNVPYEIFINFQFVEKSDIIQGVLKSFAIGAFIPIIGVYSGLMSNSGSKSVGDSTTRAVVMGLSAVGMIDLIVGGGVFMITG